MVDGEKPGVDSRDEGKHSFTSASEVTTLWRYTNVGFVAAAVSMPKGGCRARRPVVDVSVAIELTVL